MIFLNSPICQSQPCLCHRYPSCILLTQNSVFHLPLVFSKVHNHRRLVNEEFICFVYLTDPEFVLISHFPFLSNTDLCSNCASYTTYLFLFASPQSGRGRCQLVVFSLPLINEKLCMSLQSDLVNFGQCLFPLNFSSILTFILKS